MARMLTFLGVLRVAHAAESWTLVKMVHAAENNGAVCLDGSPGAYYIREPIQESSTKSWLIFNEGGGWCMGDQNCYDRSLTGLGSSRAYPDAFGGHESGDLFNNFPTFTVVYSKYCDGSSMTGDNQTVAMVNKQPIYYRGRRLLDALFDDLFNKGLGDAEQLLYGGCSAGALTTYENIDYVRSLVPVATKLVGLADAMFSLHHTNFAGQVDNYYTRQFTWGYAAWNSSANINQRCREQLGEADAWTCFHGAVAAQFVETPLLIINSKFDTWQARGVLGLNATDCPGSIASGGAVLLCDNSTATSIAEWAFWSAYGDEMVAALEHVPRRHAAFMSNCPTHCMTGGPHWRDPAFPGTRLDAAVTQWFGWAMANVDSASWSAPRWIAGHVYDQGCTRIGVVV